MRLSEIRFKPLKGEAEYGSGKVVGVPVMGFPEYWTPWYKRLLATRAGRDRIYRASGDNRERFKALFGKRQFVFNGNHFFHGWRVDLGTTEVLVMTAREHGTCYEVVTTIKGKRMPYDIPRVLEFIETICGRRGHEKGS